MSIKPILLANKLKTQIVNDGRNKNSKSPSWVSAVWIESEEWSGWTYEDDFLSDAYPLGPNPTHFIDGLADVKI